MGLKKLALTLMAGLGLISLIGCTLPTVGSRPTTVQIGKQPTATDPVFITIEATLPTVTPESILESTATPTLRGFEGYPVMDTTPGGVSILSKSEVRVVPNPVKSPPEQWKIYAESFYSYTLAYPPEWFLIESTGVRKTHGIHAQIVPGLSTSISSVDLFKAPGTEPRTVNPQDVLRIDVSLEEEPLRASESLEDYLQRQDWYWAESVKSFEATEHHGLPALSFHYDYRGLIPNGSTGLVVLITAKDGRVYKIIAVPDPKDTIYPTVFQQMLDSFVILEN